MKVVSDWQRWTFLLVLFNRKISQCLQGSTWSLVLGDLIADFAKVPWQFECFYVIITDILKISDFILKVILFHTKNSTQGR